MLANESRTSRLTVRSLAMLPLLFAATSAQALTWNVTQVTDTNGAEHEFYLSISETTLAWESTPDPWTIYSDVFMYDGSTITDLTGPGTSLSNGYEPKVSGNNVLWYSNQEHSEHIDQELFLFDGTTTTQITHNTYDDIRYDISGDNVVWEGEAASSSEIFFYDGSTITQLTNDATTDTIPVVSGDNVAWRRYQDGFWDVFAYDGTSTTRITNDVLIETDIKVAGDNIAWISRDVPNTTMDAFEVYLYDGTSVTQLTDNNVVDSLNDLSSDGKVLWQEGFHPSQGQLYLYDNGTTTHINHTQYGMSGQISGDNVAWVGWDGNDWEIFVYDGTTSTQVTDNDFDDIGVQFEGTTLAWFGETVDGNEIFMATAAPCLTGDANCDGYVDVGGDIFPAFANFTGPGSYGMKRWQGDVEGGVSPCTGSTPTSSCDGDVDVSDILSMFANFTGPAPIDDAGGLVAAEALDSTIPDLIYDASTGEVLLDLDSAVGFTGYVLNSANGFITGNHTPFMAGVTTTLPYELAEATFGTPAGPYPKSIGNVFPSGMDMAALSAFLTGNQVSRGNNQPIVPFDLVIVNPVSSGVPEPAAVVMGLMALAGLGMVAYRRRRA